MTNREIKAKVRRFQKMHHLRVVDHGTLRAAAEKQGYTVIEFNNLVNDDNITQLVCALKLQELVANTKGFTYADQHQRLIFVHEGLSNGEKTMVLAHELGHIVCGHFNSAPIIGKDVQDEYVANEFAHYLLNPGAWGKTCSWCRRHRILLGSVFSLAVLVVIVGLVLLFSSAGFSADTFYVTEGGTKYHERECMVVKQRGNLRPITWEELEKGDYEPCQVCLP